jgi:hypothetical protein
MRLWTIHPKNLDAKGLVAVWREGLLAKNVLEGKTKGYKNHPQLDRFKQQKEPVKSINTYLYYIWKEAQNRNYNFDVSKINFFNVDKINVNLGQVNYEKDLLNFKLSKRCPDQHINNLEVHPLFNVVKGDTETWEKQNVDIANNL